MKNSSSTPILNFRVPAAGRPEAVAAASDRYETAVRQLDRVSEERRELDKRGIKEARLADIQRLAERLKTDPNAEHDGEHETKAQARLEALTIREQALRIEVDQSGNALARAVGEARDEWLAFARDRHDRALAEYVAGLKRALAVLPELARARADLDFLDGFELRVALGPQPPIYFGKRPLKVLVPATLANSPREAGSWVVDADIVAEALAAVVEFEPSRVEVSA